MKDQYKTYKVTDFAADPSFINWVKGNAPQDKELWTTWLAQNPDKIEDIQQAKTLVQAMVFKQPEVGSINTKALWDKIDQAVSGTTQTIVEKPTVEKPVVMEDKTEVVIPKVTPEATTETAKIKPFSPPKAKVPAPEKPKERKEEKAKNRFLIPGLGIAAAAVLLAIFTFVFLMPDNIKIETLDSIHLDYPLPDQSVVTLNAASTLVLDTTNWSSNRTLFLEGEAFFDVTEGSPFRVNTDQGEVRVLGTSFNVFQREDRLKVACYTGKVEVAHQKQKVILNPEEYAYLDLKGTLIKDSIRNRNSNGWMDDVYSFKDEPVSEAFKEIERQFGVTVVINTPSKDSLYSGFFSGRSLKDALENVCYSMSLDYDVDLKSKVVTITELEQ
ncbi:MAG: FecR domain-containing protein [Bacteroidota bacterium]